MNTLIRTKIHTALYCGFAAAALCALTSSAQAEDVPSKTVKFQDLDITKAAGAKTLYDRIRAAAREVCDLSTSGDPILKPATHACIETAIDNAVRKVNAPALTALRFGSNVVRLASK